MNSKIVIFLVVIACASAAPQSSKEDNQTVSKLLSCLLKMKAFKVNVKNTYTLL